MSEKHLAVCDECGKEEQLRHGGTLPFGWERKALLNTDFSHHKDFCSRPCLIAYFDRHISEMKNRQQEYEKEQAERAREVLGQVTA